MSYYNYNLYYNNAHIFQLSSHISTIYRVDLREAFDVRFLHDYPQYFTFDPPMLRHTVTFNTSIVSQFFPVRSDSLSFNCGFMDGNDDENIFNSTTVTVSLQDGE